MTKPVTFSLPESVLDLIEEVRRRRRDPSRSDTVRVLLLQALGAMSFLPVKEKKALGIAGNSSPQILVLGNQEQKGEGR